MGDVVRGEDDGGEDGGPVESEVTVDVAGLLDEDGAGGAAPRIASPPPVEVAALDAGDGVVLLDAGAGGLGGRAEDAEARHRNGQLDGSGARAVQLDVTSEASIAAAAAWIRGELGRLDVLVNNAAISRAGKPGTPFEELLKANRPSVARVAEVRAVFETNVFG
ncbi:SDR family NAD(P)-dependent oxidoreductase [Sorangium sp. So ce327]